MLWSVIVIIVIIAITYYHYVIIMLSLVINMLSLIIIMLSLCYHSLSLCYHYVIIMLWPVIVVIIMLSLCYHYVIITLSLISFLLSLLSSCLVLNSYPKCLRDIIYICLNSWINNLFTALAECVFIDSMWVLQNSGYKRSRLDPFCQDLNIKRNIQPTLLLLLLW